MNLRFTKKTLMWAVPVNVGLIFIILLYLSSSSDRTRVITTESGQIHSDSQSHVNSGQITPESNNVENVHKGEGDAKNYEDAAVAADEHENNALAQIEAEKAAEQKAEEEAKTEESVKADEEAEKAAAAEVEANRAKEEAKVAEEAAKAKEEAKKAAEEHARLEEEAAKSKEAAEKLAADEREKEAARKQAAEDEVFLDKHGYLLKPQNVKFKYIGPNDRTAQDAFENNQKIYTEAMNKQALFPTDYDVSLLKPPPGDRIHEYKREKATIVSLVRNEELGGITGTIKQFERMFNAKFQYPYTFINDVAFSDEFKETVKKLTKAECEFVVISQEMWAKPDSIDSKLQEKNMQKLADMKVSYAKMESYHNMCRFYLGAFYHLPELQKYQYYWRIEPDVTFYSSIHYDVFKYMKRTGKKYGFNVNIYDIQQTIETLWTETLAFLNKGDNYKYVNPKGAFQWLVYSEQHPEKADYTGGYSTCHFWSNFEIGDMELFRGEAYQKWFQHLEETGKFYYERWGDAPVHAIGVGLFADAQKEVHWFKDIGYLHIPYNNCPKSPLTVGCDAGSFCSFKHAYKENCMGTWIKTVGDAPYN